MRKARSAVLVRDSTVLQYKKITRQEIFAEQVQMFYEPKLIETKELNEIAATNLQ